MLKEKINSDYLKAFKEKNAVTKSLLSVVKGEIQTLEKNTGVDNLSDEDVIKILKKVQKSLKETISSISNKEEGVELSNATFELMIVEGYLPKELSREDITKKILELKESGITNIGQIMKEFSNLPVDRKVVSEVIKEVI
jgi:uncharacterized protein YqeY